MGDREILRRPRVFLEACEALGLGHTLALVGHYDNVHARQMLMEHRHAELMEVCYLARGRQVYRVAGTDYAMKAGELFVTFPGEQHSTGGKPEEKGELFWMQLRLPEEGPFLNLQGEEARPVVTGLRDLAARHFRANEAVRELFPRLFVRLAEAIEGPAVSGIDRLEVSGLCCQLLVEVIRSANQRARAGEMAYDADMNRAIGHIAAHLGEMLSVGDVAREMRLSESWFKAKFRRAMGIGPGEYILRAKVERAGELLRGGRRVTQVAQELGFSSSQYFATVFRRFTGRSPGEWRSGGR